MKKAIMLSLVAAFLVSPFALVSASSANVAVVSSTSGVSQMDENLRIRAAWKAATKLAKTKRVQTAVASVAGFVDGFFNGGDDNRLLENAIIPETALD